ncbi:MAG: DUF2817 domain-containing protein [Bdellovibrionales bacterium]|nr:DUF2817 domain-containing protein [Bdellovibrionales bacterium]
MHKQVWAKSGKSRDIELYTSNNTLEKLHHPLLLIGGMHGDEPEGVYLAELTLEWALQVPLKALNDFALIPCINPDGFAQNQRVNANGVDLNRNFPSHNWSPEFKESRYYPGPYAGSEIEVQALIKLIANIRPRLIIYFHSWKPCVVVTGPKNLEEAVILSNYSGFELVHDIGYATPGSLGEYGWHDLQIPIICTEDSEHRDRNLSWQHFGEGIKKILLKQ